MSSTELTTNKAESFVQQDMIPQQVRCVNVRGQSDDPSTQIIAIWVEPTFKSPCDHLISGMEVTLRKILQAAVSVPYRLRVYIDSTKTLCWCTRFPLYQEMLVFHAYKVSDMVSMPQGLTSASKSKVPRQHEKSAREGDY